MSPVSFMYLDFGGKKSHRFQKLCSLFYVVCSQLQNTSVTDMTILTLATTLVHKIQPQNICLGKQNRCPLLVCVPVDFRGKNLSGFESYAIYSMQHVAKCETIRNKLLKGFLRISNSWKLLIVNLALGCQPLYWFRRKRKLQLSSSQNGSKYYYVGWGRGRAFLFFLLFFIFPTCFQVASNCVTKEAQAKCAREKGKEMENPKNGKSSA